MGGTCGIGGFGFDCVIVAVWLSGLRGVNCAMGDAPLMCRATGKARRVEGIIKREEVDACVAIRRTGLLGIRMI